MFMCYVGIGVGHTFSVTADNESGLVQGDEELAGEPDDEGSVDQSNHEGTWHYLRSRINESDDGDDAASVDNNDIEFEDNGSAQDDLDMNMGDNDLGPEDGEGGWVDIEGENGFGEL